MKIYIGWCLLVLICFVITVAVCYILGGNLKTAIYIGFATMPCWGGLSLAIKLLTGE